MAPTPQQVKAWLDAYVQAWLSYNPDAIGALFSEDASYAWHPWDEGADVARGRAAIVKAWLDDQDTPGTYQAEYEPLAIEGDLAIATGRSRYFTKAGALEREFYNCWVLRFDERGQCTSFTEWFMQAPS
jgi:hypothetical protein